MHPKSDAIERNSKFVLQAYQDELLGKGRKPDIRDMELPKWMFLRNQ